MRVLAPFVISLAFLSSGISCIHQRKLAGGYDYSDGPLGPSHWAENYETCGGAQQSPIDVPHPLRFRSKVVGWMLPIKFLYSLDDGQESVEFIDNGHTVEAVYSGKNLKLSGVENLPFVVDRSDDKSDLNEFTLEQFHFHWGTVDEKGSEHTLWGRRHPMEMHLVHWNSGKYDNFTHATGFPDGLLVVALFFDVPEDGSEVQVDVLRDPRDAMSSKEFKKHDEILIRGFDLGQVVKGLDAHKFYVYPGSLTTPSCNEIVTWVLMKDLLYTTEQTMQDFRNVIGEHEHNLEMANNFRPVQKGNGRIIIDAEKMKYSTIGDNVKDTATDYLRAS